MLVLTPLLHFQRAGHMVVVPVGGATARICDPSRNNSEREDLQNNAGIRDDIEQEKEEGRSAQISRLLIMSPGIA